MTYEEIWQKIKRMSQRNRRLLAYEMTLKGFDKGYTHPHYYFDAKAVHDGVPEPDICDFPEYFDELGIEKEKSVLGMCRFVPEKRLHDLVHALAKWQETAFFAD